MMVSFTVGTRERERERERESKKERRQSTSCRSATSSNNVYWGVNTPLGISDAVSTDRIHFLPCRIATRERARISWCVRRSNATGRCSIRCNSKDEDVLFFSFVPYSRADSAFPHPPPLPPTYDSKVLRNSYAEYYQVWKSFRYSRKLLVFTRNARRCKKTSLEKRWENLGVSFLKSRFKFSRCVV